MVACTRRAYRLPSIHNQLRSSVNRQTSHSITPVTIPRHPDAVHRLMSKRLDPVVVPVSGLLRPSRVLRCPVSPPTTEAEARWEMFDNAVEDFQTLHNHPEIFERFSSLPKFDKAIRHGIHYGAARTCLVASDYYIRHTSDVPREHHSIRNQVLVCLLKSSFSSTGRGPILAVRGRLKVRPKEHVYISPYLQQLDQVKVPYNIRWNWSFVNLTGIEDHVDRQLVRAIVQFLVDSIPSVDLRNLILNACELSDKKRPACMLDQNIVERLTAAVEAETWTRQSFAARVLSAVHSAWDGKSSHFVDAAIASCTFRRHFLLWPLPRGERGGDAALPPGAPVAQQQEFRSDGCDVLLDA